MRIGAVGGKPCVISLNTPNRSVCITGLSGTGKTVRLTQLELESLQEGAVVVVIDLGQTHRPDEIFEPLKGKFLQKAVYFDAMEGLGLGLFHTLETAQGKREPFAHVVNSAVSALSAGQRMGVGQIGALREAVIDVVQNRRSFENEAEALAFALKSRADNDGRAAAVYQKLWTFLHCGVLGSSHQCLQVDKINVINLSELDVITQSTMAEVILHTLWRKIQFLGLPKERPRLTVVLDEFQILNGR